MFQTSPEYSARYSDVHLCQHIRRSARRTPAFNVPQIVRSSNAREFPVLRYPKPRTNRNRLPSVSHFWTRIKQEIKRGAQVIFGLFSDSLSCLRVHLVIGASALSMFRFPALGVLRKRCIGTRARTPLDWQEGERQARMCENPESKMPNGAGELLATFESSTGLRLVIYAKHQGDKTAPGCRVAHYVKGICFFHTRLHRLFLRDGRD
ncbi:hypothetical protein B0H11DRAFT_1933687 [Mycena galericulata]|nr:hypothetical protein B0H11DRAFT_1933687 [Mycena galericulata]